MTPHSAKSNGLACVVTGQRSLINVDDLLNAHLFDLSNECVVGIHRFSTHNVANRFFLYQRGNVRINIVLQIAFVYRQRHAGRVERREGLELRF